MSSLPIAVLLSGSGRTLQNLLDRIRDGTLPARIAVVISSKDDAYGLTRAREAGVPAAVVPRKRYVDDASFGRAVLAEIAPHAPGLVAMAGLIHRVLLPREFEGRVMNIHPALLPAFGGKGFYGERVHRAVIESGAKVSGCTVHFVDEQYDHGPIILQRTVPVLDDDTPHALADRVFVEECVAYPAAIRLFAEGRLRIERMRVRVIDVEKAKDVGERISDI